MYISIIFKYEKYRTCIKAQRIKLSKRAEPTFTIIKKSNLNAGCTERRREFNTLNRETMTNMLFGNFFNDLKAILIKSYSLNTIHNFKNVLLHLLF